jgi:hypothetical protein
MSTTVDPAMEWFALTKAVVESLQKQGMARKYLRLVPYAIAMGMTRRPSYGEAVLN